MNNEVKANDSAHGSAQEWDAIWKQIGVDGNTRAKAFTRSKPKDIIQFWQRCYFEDLLLTMQPCTDWKFLELASGRGTTSLYLASRGFHNLTLLDLSDTALEQARKNFASENVSPPTMIVGDAEATGLPDNTYDCIYNIGVLEHFEDPTSILAESYRLLKPGGKIFMPIVPAIPFSHSIVCRVLLNPISLAKQLAKWVLRRAPPASSMTRTEAGTTEYRQISQKVGFDDVKCVSYNPYWKLYRDGSRFETGLVLPIYRLHHALKAKFGIVPRLRTSAITNFCLLLTAAKPEKAA